MNQTLTEALIQKGIVDVLEQFGFSCYHTRFALDSDSGFPDIVAVREDGAIVAVECKGPRGQLRPLQLDWIQRFRQSADCRFSEVVGPEPNDRWLGYDEALERLQEALS